MDLDLFGTHHLAYFHALKYHRFLIINLFREPLLPFALSGTCMLSRPLEVPFVSVNAHSGRYVVFACV